MKHIMLDLETLGTRPNCPILTLGAVYFDPDTGELGDEIYMRVDIQSNFDAGRKPSGSTIEWWFSQKTEAQDALFDQSVPLYKLEGALTELGLFCQKCGLKKGPRVWSNGATFDIAIIQDACESLNIAVPWQYYNAFDVRTIKLLASPTVKVSDVPFTGTKHKALDDAKHQAEYVSLMYSTIKSGLKK